MSTNRKVHIHWFGNDLRTIDQPFTQITDKVDQLIALYIIDEKRTAYNEWGFRNMSLERLQVLREHLVDLEEELAACGIPLIVKFGDPGVIVPFEVQKRNASLSFMNEYATDERNAQQDVLGQLEQDDVFHYDGNFLIHPQFCSWTEGFPSSFSRFRKKAEKALKNQEYKLFEPLQGSKTSVEPQLKTSGRHINKKSALPFPGGSSSGIDRLIYYLFESKKASSYKQTRNGLIGKDYSTKFSFWLAVGALSPMMIMKELKKYEEREGSNKSTYWIFFELLWRDFFRHAGKFYNDDFFAKKGAQKSSWECHESKIAFDEWVNGNTLNDFVNANMVELAESGFMSNRGRQNAASYLVHDQSQDWRKGAAWFEHHLLDYDVYSNHGNWQYVTGVSFNPKGGSHFNCRSQADRYDGDHKFRETWLK